MPATIILRKKEYQVEAGQTVQQALTQIGLLPESYLALRDGELITEFDRLCDDDRIKLVAVISGGAAAQ